MPKFYLKDWHDKEQEFTDDKIFVRGEDGELIQFTQGEGDIPAVLQDKTITENGTYTADSGFDGLGSVLVEVAGAGGGGLPAGAYWRAFDEITKPSDYPYNNWIFFELGDELYAAVAGSDSETNVGMKYYYKMVNGAWVKLADETFVDASMYQVDFHEFNGKLHFLPKYGKCHWTFDGTAMVQMANFPYTMDRSQQLFVQNGKLKAWCNNKNIYVWDETTDIWSVEASKVLNSAYPGIFVIDDVVYMSYLGKMYIYDNGAITEYATMTKTPDSYESNAIVNGKAYYHSGSNIYCFDFATKTERSLGAVPAKSGTHLKEYNGKLLFSEGTTSKGSSLQLYEVTE